MQLATLILLALALLATPTQAHNWYDGECCSERDCRQTPLIHICEIPASKSVRCLYVPEMAGLMPRYGARPNHRGGMMNQATEEKYSKAIVTLLAKARQFSLDVLFATDEEKRAKLSRLHEDMEAEVFRITGVRYHLGIGK